MAIATARWDMATVCWEIAARPMPGEDVCGDMGFVAQVDQYMFIALIDAAGHGPVAHMSGVRALAFLENHCRDMEPGELVVALHHHMARHRGVVAALCWLNLCNGTIRHVGTGNIVTRVYGAATHEFINSAGLIGSSISPQLPRVEEIRLQDGDLLVLHSDGISSRARVTHVPDLVEADVGAVAARMVAEYGRENDDASCLALRYSVENGAST